MHPLALRQLRKAGFDPAGADERLTRLLTAVSDAYVAADDDRERLERSLDLASEELVERNRRLGSELANSELLNQRLGEAVNKKADLERNYHALFELSPIGILATDRQTDRIVHLNDAIANASGYSRAELLCMHGSNLLPQGPNAVLPKVNLALETSSRFGPLEAEIERRDGTRYDVLLAGIFTADDAGREIIWWLVQDISARKAMEQELSDRARRDRLTGLATRLVLLEEIAFSLKRVQAGEQAGFSVMFLDFDRFKLVNDTLGHAAGDELLRQIGDRLRKSLGIRPGGWLAEDGSIASRFGGDEFVLLLNGTGDAAAATEAAEGLRSIFLAPYQISGNEVISTASIGIVTSDRAAASGEDFIRNADVAMYEAKRAGRGVALMFDDQMHARVVRRVAVERELRRAVRAGELRLVYQPIVDLGDGRVLGVEALARWRDPLLGDVPPNEFIPVAEECGLIIDLGRWVQRAACEMMVRWRSENPQDAPRSVSVNMSLAELSQGARIVAQVREVLESTGLPAQCLQLEITEREIMIDPAQSRQTLQELRAMGVRIAMDDFGTGTSSLGVLRHFPFDTIKIDRSIVQDLTANPDVLAVVHAAINLIDNLGMMSVVEGVEMPEQVAVLQALGCRAAQGFLFGMPVDGSSIPDVVRSCRNLRGATPRRAVAVQKTPEYAVRAR